MLKLLKREKTLTLLKENIKNIDDQKAIKLNPLKFEDFVIYIIRNLFGKFQFEKKDFFRKIYSSNMLVSTTPCTICYERILNDLFIPSCGHLYHYDCLNTWFQIKEKNNQFEKECCYCRQILNEFMSLGYIILNDTKNIYYLIDLSENNNIVNTINPTEKISSLFNKNKRILIFCKDKEDYDIIKLNITEMTKVVIISDKINQDNKIYNFKRKNLSYLNQKYPDVMISYKKINEIPADELKRKT